LSKVFYESSEKLQHSLSITHLPTLPTGRQAQAGISKDDYKDYQRFLGFFRNLFMDGESRGA